MKKIMKKKEPEVDFICEKCGKHPPVNKELSSDNWTVYDTSEPCGCGGKWKMQFLR